MLKKIRSFLINKIVNRIRYLRYSTNYISINENNLDKVKNLSHKLNKKELQVRKEYLKTKINHNFSDYFLIKLNELKSLGYTIFSNEYLKNISEYSESFKYFDNKFSKVDVSTLRFNEIFHVLNIDLQDVKIRNLINIFIPFVANYLNILPVVTAASLWYSSPKQRDGYIGSQLPHFDHEDTMQVKIYVALNDINKLNGVLNVYEKQHSIKIKNILNKKNIELNKKTQEDSFKNHTPVELNLKKGDVAVVDTASCYHFGGRTKENYRKQITILLNDPFCSMYPLFRFFDKKKDLIWDYSNFSYDKIKTSKQIKIF